MTRIKKTVLFIFLLIFGMGLGTFLISIFIDKKKEFQENKLFEAYNQCVDTAFVFSDTIIDYEFVQDTLNLTIPGTAVGLWNIMVGIGVGDEWVFVENQSKDYEIIDNKVSIKLEDIIDINHDHSRLQLNIRPCSDCLVGLNKYRGDLVFYGNRGKLELVGVFKTKRKELVKVDLEKFRRIVEDNPEIEKKLKSMIFGD